MLYYDRINVSEGIDIKNTINPYNCLLKKENFSVKTTNDQITPYIIK